ncbi:TonB-dependent siderophore receptor [Pseudomonas sp. NPDC089401]|uniref:TonB-dependent siderophore receptor n=1 Tax=Pseudomonas sp. NPDC089401 TaxID=3364462 RepID=UPI00382C8259
MLYNASRSLVVGSALVLSIPAVAASFDFDLPAQPLSQALRQIGLQAGVSLAFDERTVAGKSAPALKGRYDTESAVRMVLMGSGLSLDTQGAVWLIAAPAGDSLELDATTVNSSGLGETSEGSGSYTTGPLRGATKLPLTLKETPQSATVITRQRIDDQQLNSLNDVVKTTPGLTVQMLGADRQRYYARGTLIDNLMYDGVPTTTGGGGSDAVDAADMAMFDRVEVVRGSTGLMQGAGNPSASINMVRKQPTATPQASVQVSGGSWDRYRGEVDVSGPLNEQGSLRGRMVGAYQDYHSFQDHAETERGLFYGVLAADLSDATTLTVGASRQKDNQNTTWGGLPMAANGSDLHLSRSTYLGTDWDFWDKTSEMAFLSLEQRLARDWKLQFNVNKTWSTLDLAATKVIDPNLNNVFNLQLADAMYHDRQSSYDLFASGPFQLFGREHQLVVGTSRYQEKYLYNGASYRILANGIDVNSWDPSSIAKTRSPRDSDRQAIDINQKGLYSTVRFKLADPLTLILGGRLDWYDYSTDYYWSNGTPGHASYKVTRNVTKYAGLVYDLNEQYSVYASYTDIFKPQNYRAADSSLIEPVVGKNYEVGLKGAWFEGLLNGTLAVYRMNQVNRAFQLSDAQCGNTGVACYGASGKVRSQGIDLELQGALTPRWQVGGGYTFNAVKTVRDSNAANEGKNFDTDLPRHLFKLTTTYALPGPMERWRVGGTLYTQSRVYNKGTGYTIEQSGYSLVDLMLGYNPTEHMETQVNFNNVFDRRYYASIGDSPVRGESIYGMPRNVMMSLKYRF